ncbi:mechanosensitive ion channel family protein [Phaeobacter gallaeciensis]|uniref:Small-conductance mechanosensitive channel n=1 Tax=Phaeobacter gallaeciensis TaxID=60890 RepID=A0AAC9Z6Q3_9RHOB|nr:mechanosensitive ion channel family protein [Phaeobacter gallaeciensis]AHD08300.1 Small-conductance mechanosensitive channel [Phaeobacter gallaeciensis DSM 26640]ATE91566.1 putative small-conductance mechanosensitive channel [Phaeobacter gallaeciensis]ATE95842.1 putative small-conductance mechanosensitive channel [Phaeobacter gallaeciensis]ATF00182.1 putative small-conductance mechanosensitive channel [Phaeobacter gallaeciensis]ATF04614.1 putative small-conductance mechanosensitive channel 
MDSMNALMQTEIYNGKSLADLVTLEFLAQAMGSVLAAIVILLAGFIVASWVKRRIVQIGDSHASLDVTLFHFLGNLARYVILAFALLFVLNTFGVETTSIIAAIGAAGLAIGLAMQGALSNVAAGIMLILFRPFKLGDFIEVNDEMGTVKEITLNNTVIASLSNLKVIIPNSEVWGNTITNYSEFDTRRAEWTFGVGYGANLARAEQVIRDTIMSDSRSHAEPDPFIQVNNLNSSSVDFLVRVWVDAAEYFQYQADMKRRVKEALDEAGIDIPFPTRTLVQASPDASQQASENGDQQDRTANRNEAAA